MARASFPSAVASDNGVGAQQAPPSISDTPIDNGVGAQQAPPSISDTPIDNLQSRSNPARSTRAAAAPLRDDVGDDDPAGLGINVTPGSLGAIVRSYKASVTRMVDRCQATPSAPIWQRGYWERVVRGDRELAATRRYIAENPIRAAEDREDLDALLARMRYENNTRGAYPVFIRNRSRNHGLRRA